MKPMNNNERPKHPFFDKFVIGPDNDPYIIRWILFSCPLFGIMVHKMLRSDYDRALHDHPWDFLSIVLKGGYAEEFEERGVRDFRFNAPGHILFRKAEFKHRVILDKGKICWTLVFKGPRRRKWGFWIRDYKIKNGTWFRWCWWRKYDEKRGYCSDHIVHAGGGD